ncbi:MAG: hypothetical protein KA099_07640 [Alphaproteobacteria bacterium]|nr:hypothetical protein [Alphaproteobacteria bacterium]MBP7757883.1 hypothetical protein [Alphaproteobacteria bacterium]MBP7761210.1 hypothetical protein [Alphaproteobacteria bacterium]MBP7905184.1 hypothetical protein [Alphaproteobacteria bacterium]
MSENPATVRTEKTLFDVLRDIWAARIAMLVTGFAGFAVAFTFVTLARPYYRAEMILAPASPIGQGGFQLPTLPDRMLWQSQSVQNYPNFMKFENKFNAPSVAGLLLEDEKIVRGLILDQTFDFIAPEVSWTPEKLSRYLTRSVRLEPVGNTPLRKLVYLHPDRNFAAYLIERVHQITDTLIRQTLRLETQERIAYLHESLSKTVNPEHRRALADLLMEQERLKMLVSMDQPYAASIVEPASSGVKPDWPHPRFVFPTFILIGFFLGFVIYGIFYLHD